MAPQHSHTLTLNNRPFNCLACGGAHFTRLPVLWQNWRDPLEAAVCVDCGYVHTFASDKHVWAAA